MKLDLQKDAEKIRRYIEKRIQDYPIYENIGPGEDADPIAFVALGYYLDQTGYFNLIFDTRPDADSDGEWTLHIDNEVNMLPFPNWCAAIEKLHNGGNVAVKLTNGKTETLAASDVGRVNLLFGEAILEVMLSLRDAGAFDELPLSPKAFFIIEEFDGNWGWPGYDKRKTLGLLRKKK